MHIADTTELDTVQLQDLGILNTFVNLHSTELLSTAVLK